mgnify:CR=1 FL=1
MSSKQEIAFIKHGDFSSINAKVLGILNRNFPDAHIEIIDIFSDLLSKKDVSNLYYCLKEYGIDILLGKRSVSTATYLRTPYIVDKIKKAIPEKLTNKHYTFTFQTQSLFDASIPGIPHFVYTDHTHLASLQYPAYNPHDLPCKELIKLERQVYQNATANFTMSSNISKSMIEDYSCSPEKVSCVYCGANIQVQEDESFTEDRYFHKNILFVGKDWERKGGPLLAEAFKTVLNHHSDATLTVVGCTPDLNLPNCNVVGEISLPNVKEYFKQASIFCLPTKIEPFGIVFLEAMACKLPIVASNIGAIPEFIIEDENGYMVEPNNSQQLARRIIDLISSPEKCKAFGEYGYELFWNRYTWEKTGLRIRKNIEQFL